MEKTLEIPRITNTTIKYYVAGEYTTNSYHMSMIIKVSMQYTYTNQKHTSNMQNNA